jgi:hypothetical protein
LSSYFPTWLTAEPQPLTAPKGRGFLHPTKSQLLAAKTLTNDFHANDILWQLNILAYNLSLMMRYRVKKVFKQEHATFRNWFINVPAKLVRRSRQLELKIYECYYFREQ